MPLKNVPSTGSPKLRPSESANQRCIGVESDLLKETLGVPELSSPIERFGFTDAIAPSLFGGEGCFSRGILAAGSSLLAP